MNYSSIKPLDTANGFGINVSVYFSGCDFRCPGCHNKDYWSFDCGEGWTEEIENKVIEYVKSPHIKHLCILGGEPLQQDLNVLYNFIRRVKEETGKSIIMWTGYTWEAIVRCMRFQRVVSECEILIDGQFRASEKDLSLAHKGSRNQREINVKKSLEENKIILWE